MRGGHGLRVYCSTETHSWLKKSMELMGMGRASLHAVGVDAGYRMKMDELKAGDSRGPRSRSEAALCGCDGRHGEYRGDG